MNQEKIGKFIAECRKDKKLTQSQLAEKLNMSNKSISKWETGRGMPDSAIMLELCNYLDINVNELLSGEHINKEDYQQKVNENILSITKISEKNKKIKNQLIIVLIVIAIFVILFLSFVFMYNNLKLNIDYDERLISCTINNENIICNFSGLSLVNFEYYSLNHENETLIFINGKILLQNKIRSHFETWDSMAQLNNYSNVHFSSTLILDKNKDIVNCNDRIKVYYTPISIKKIKKLIKIDNINLNKLINSSYLIVDY